MAVWFPELRAVLAKKLGPHFPPHPFRILAGAALSAVVSGMVLGTLLLTYKGLAATWSGVQAVSERFVQSLERPALPNAAELPNELLAQTKPTGSPPVPASVAASTPPPSVSAQPARAVPSEPVPPLVPPAPYPDITDPHAVHEAILSDALPYAESTEAPLNDGVKQVDFALVQTINRLGLERSRFEPLYASKRPGPQEPYFFQRIRIHINGTPAEFMASLNETLEAWAERATLEPWVSPPEPLISSGKKPQGSGNENTSGTNLRASVANAAPLAPLEPLEPQNPLAPLAPLAPPASINGMNALRVSIDGITTHELFLSPVSSVFIPAPPAGEPLLTVVIDDLGANMAPVKELLELDLPITFSIMPRTAHAADVARAVHAAGQEVLIHQPMEPMQAPYIKPGPGALLLSMKAEAMRDMLRANMQKVPYASGLNNHMGSRLTRDVTATQVISEEASAAGLFVLDSLTHADSHFYEEARRKGLTAYRRDFFLDDGVITKSSVLRVLNEAEKMAKSTGQAVVIGHPKPETLAALKEWAHSRDGSVALVPLRYQSPPQ